MGLLRSIMALSGILNIFMPMTMAIDPACDFYQDMAAGQVYYIYNQEYPNSYGPSTSCRWMAYSPVGTRIVISCEDITLPSTQNCAGDRLSISQSGDPNFSDARNYCGQGSVTLVSTSNSLVVGLFSTWNTAGGRFVCSLTSIDDGSSTTTPRPNQCDCGWKQQTRIVGGHETGVNEYPSMAGLIDLSNRNLYCGSSIISDKYVLTAAHCLYNRQASSVGVLVGDHNVSSGAETDHSYLYSSVRLIIHQSYDPDNQINDIGLVQTTKIMSFSLYVGPVCLPFRYTSTSFAGNTVTALGWGQLEFSGPKSDTLQEVDLNVITNSACQSQMPNNIITNGQICTYAPGKDACQYDSGGPLLWMDGAVRRLQLLGILSYGIGCATTNPGVNTRVTSYLTWIVSQTNDANYCIK